MDEAEDVKRTQGYYYLRQNRNQKSEHEVRPMLEITLDNYGAKRLTKSRSWQMRPPQSSVTVRAVKQTDVVLIHEMHKRVSKDSLYYRYLGPKAPKIENLKCLCDANKETATVLVAVIHEPEEMVVALAYYQIDPENSTTAEPAILVEDSFQGFGLGKLIIEALCRDALKKGVKTFDIYVDPSNYRMRHMIQRSGLRYESKFSNGLSDIRVWLNSNGQISV